MTNFLSRFINMIIIYYLSFFEDYRDVLTMLKADD